MEAGEGHCAPVGPEFCSRHHACFASHPSFPSVALNQANPFEALSLSCLWRGVWAFENDRGGKAERDGREYGESERRRLVSFAVAAARLRRECFFMFEVDGGCWTAVRGESCQTRGQKGAVVAPPAATTARRRLIGGFGRRCCGRM
jgi:hypothetical protein